MERINKNIKLIVALALIIVFLNGCTIANNTKSFDLNSQEGLTNSKSQVDPVKESTFSLKDGSISIAIPEGWYGYDHSIDTLSRGLIINTDILGDIQLMSVSLPDEEKDITPESIFNRLEFGNDPGGKITYTLLSKNSLSINGIDGDLFEISGDDVSGTEVQGLIAILVGNTKKYLMSFITTPEYFETNRNTFLTTINTATLK